MIFLAESEYRDPERLACCFEIAQVEDVKEEDGGRREDLETVCEPHLSPDQYLVLHSGMTVSLHAGWTSPA